MNPETNRFEMLKEDQEQPDPSIEELKRFVRQQNQLLRPNGQPVPEHWTQFQIGECVVIKNYTFRVAYIGETSILFEPVGIPDLGVK